MFVIESMLLCCCCTHTLLCYGEQRTWPLVAAAQNVSLSTTSMLCRYCEVAGAPANNEIACLRAPGCRSGNR